MRSELLGSEAQAASRREPSQGCPARPSASARQRRCAARQPQPIAPVAAASGSPTWSAWSWARRPQPQAYASAGCGAADHLHHHLQQAPGFWTRRVLLFLLLLPPHPQTGWGSVGGRRRRLRCPWWRCRLRRQSRARRRRWGRQAPWERLRGSEATQQATETPEFDKAGRIGIKRPRKGKYFKSSSKVSWVCHVRCHR